MPGKKKAFLSLLLFLYLVLPLADFIEVSAPNSEVHEILDKYINYLNIILQEQMKLNFLMK